MNPTDLLLAFIASYQEGSIVLPAGLVAWKIPTKGKPRQVWVSEVATGSIPVCHGYVNTVGVTYLPDGFVLNADVKSDMAQFDYQVVLETNNANSGPGLVGEA